MKDSIEISSVVADALSASLNQDFCRVEMPERMAWIVLVLKNIPDMESTFPHGKWATIQHIESQLDMAAKDKVRSLTEDKGKEKP